MLEVCINSRVNFFKSFKSPFISNNTLYKISRSLLNSDFSDFSEIIAGKLSPKLGK